MDEKRGEIGFRGLENKLPSDILQPAAAVPDKQALSTYLRLRLPQSDVNDITSTIKKNFPLTKERQVFQKRVRAKGCSRQPRLSGTCKRKLGLLKISRKGLKFDEAVPIHLLWVEYMKQYLPYLETNNFDRDGNVLSIDLYHHLWKADFHGAYITVTKSKCPSLVGQEGILIFETKNVFKLIGRDDTVRTIPKCSSEFKMRVGGFEVSFYGKNLMMRPTERSKKFKSSIQLSLNPK